MAIYKSIVKKISVPSNKKTKQKDYIPSGLLPIIDQGKELIGGYTNDLAKKINCNLPVIVFGDHTKAVKFISFPFGAGADGIKILEPKDSVCPKFLYYGTLYLTFCIENKGYARHYQYIEKEDLFVPSIPEQERIVARIEEPFSQLDASVAELQAAKKRLKVYRQAVLKEAFLGNLTKNYRYDIDIDLEWSLENATKYLPRIPSEWRYIPLSKLGDLGRGKSKHRPRNDDILFENGKYPFIQTGDIKSANKANKYVTTYSKMYGDYGLQQSKLWPKGTLCITIAANIAETAFLGIDACFPDSVVGFTAYEHVLPAYIKYFIESEKIRLWAFAPATAQKNINLDTLENLIVPYCSLKEQQKVVDEIESRFSVCDSIEKTIDTALQQAEALRQSILKQAFEGKL